MAVDKLCLLFLSPSLFLSLYGLKISSLPFSQSKGPQRILKANQNHKSQIKNKLTNVFKSRRSGGGKGSRAEGRQQLSATAAAAETRLSYTHTHTRIHSCTHCVYLVCLLWIIFGKVSFDELRPRDYYEQHTTKAEKKCVYKENKKNNNIPAYAYVCMCVPYMAAI